MNEQRKEFNAKEQHMDRVNSKEKKKRADNQLVVLLSALNIEK